jgi:iron complex outermembrane receptor protein
VYLQSTEGAVAQSASWHDFSPRAVLRYVIAEDSSVYVNLSRGYKSGGFNVLVPAGGSFAPERVLSLESGYKTAFHERAGYFDVTAFGYRYTNLQVQLIDAFPITQSAGRARGYGAESSLQYRMPGGLELRGSLAYLNARYRHYSPSEEVSYAGNTLSRSPEWSGAAGIDYVMSFASRGTLRMGLQERFQTHTFLDPANTPEQRAGGYALTDLRLTYSPREAWDVTLFLNNAFERRYVTATQTVDALGISVFQAGLPRTWGVRAAARF